MSIKRLKVYGGGGMRPECPYAENRHGQTREIVAASSETAALRILKPFGVRKGYLCETGNPEEVALAMSEPGAVFWAPLGHSHKRWRRNGSVEVLGT